MISLAAPVPGFTKAANIFEGGALSMNGSSAQRNANQAMMKGLIAKKKQEKRKQLIEAVHARNVSPIKGPADLNIDFLDQIDILNHNDYSSHWIPKGSDEDEESSSDGGGDDNDVEDLGDYRPDGYHVAHIGEIVDSKYVLLKKLGWGHFSTVWLAFKLSDKQLYALKI